METLNNLIICFIAMRHVYIFAIKSNVHKIYFAFISKYERTFYSATNNVIALTGCLKITINFIWQFVPYIDIKKG